VSGVYRDARYGLLSVNQPWIDPIMGWARTRDCREEWWRARKSEENADRSERKASGIQMLIEIMQGLDVKNADGSQMTMQQLGQTYLNAAIQGQCIVAPLATFDLASIEKNPELAGIPQVKVKEFDWGETATAVMAHLERIDKLDTKIMRSYCRPEREAMEGQHGTKAEAGTQGAIGTLDSEFIASQAMQQYNRQVLSRWAVTNFGADAAEVVGLVQAPLSDPQQQFLQDFAKALAQDTNTGQDFQANVDQRALLDRVEVPMVSKDDAQKTIDAAKAEKAESKPQMGPNGMPLGHATQSGDNQPVNGNGQKNVNGNGQANDNANGKKKGPNLFPAAKRLLRKAR